MRVCKDCKREGGSLSETGRLVAKRGSQRFVDRPSLGSFLTVAAGVLIERQGDQVQAPCPHCGGVLGPAQS